MELYERRSAPRHRPPAAAARWCKEWVPQNLVSNANCSLFKWVREDMREKSKEAELEEAKSEPTTEVLFLCSYEGCGKTFIDAMALRKHSHVHGGREFVCQFEGCGKKFADNSKLKRHFLIHTGERDFVCHYEGCGKAFSLDFNLRAHMKTHSLENYRVCPYDECGRRFTNESKLRGHIKAQHEKNTPMDVKHTPKPEKVYTTPKTPAAVYGSASSDRPYACPYEGCGKAYIHEYKLNLHLRTLHPGHNLEENGKHGDHEMDEGSDQDAYIGKSSKTSSHRRSKPSPIQKMASSKVVNPKAQMMAQTNINTAKKLPWPGKDVYGDDSEETEEDQENDSDSDDEETEEED